MNLPDFQLHDCKTLAEASDLLGEYAPNARLLAGGTDLLVDLKTGRLAVDHLISLNRVGELRGINQVDDGLRIGALTTIAELDRSPVVGERFPGIRDATKKMAVPQIRNIATIGGNLASAVPCADLPPILMVLGARLTLWSAGGKREVPLDSFFLGLRRTTCGQDEIIMHVHVPAPPEGSGAAFARFGLREGNAIAVVSVAAGVRIDGSGLIQDACVVLGAVAPIPKPVPHVAEVLVGRSADEEAFAEAARLASESAEPISDVRGSAQFRRELVEVLTQRALVTARGRAMETEPCR